MSLAPSRETAEEEVVVFSAPIAELTHELLHAMGQPLTILQMCRLFVASPETISEQTMALLPELAEQVERVTELYRGVRSLFEAEAGGVPRKRLSLATLVHRLLPEWQRRAAEQHVGVPDLLCR